MGRVIPDSVQMIWALEAADPARPGSLWCGTIPGGLFHSTDYGASWRLVESLWNHPDRAKWFGGGADWPGIHSILVDPRDRRRLLIAESCGGVWESRDNGETWQNIGAGLRAEFMPPDQAGDPGIQDAHRNACRHPAVPTRSGCSITTVSSSATTAAKTGSRS